MTTDEELEKLRKEIDEIDKKILRLVEKRVKIVKKIGKIKREKNIGIADPEREKEIIENVTRFTSLDKNFVKKLFQLIIEHCKNEEQK